MEGATIVFQLRRLADPAVTSQSHDCCCERTAGGRAYAARSRAGAFWALSGLYLAFAASRPERDRPVICPFRRITGHRCPLCGLTRGIGLSLRGKFTRSGKQHPAAPVVTPLLLCAFVIGLFRVARQLTDWRKPGQ